jgi:thiol-disulfide isomerase/thioredoxin
MSLKNNLVSIVLLLIASVSQAQKVTKPFTVQPEELKAGQVVHVTFQPELCPPLDPSGKIYAILISFRQGVLTSRDTLMQRKRKELSACFIIPEDADAVAFKFIQDGSQYSNNGKGIFYKVADKNGKEQVSSLYSLYRLYSGNPTAGVTKYNQAKSSEYYKKWAELADHSNASFYDRANLLIGARDTAGFKTLIGKISESPNISEGQFSTLAIIAQFAGKQIVDAIVKEHHTRYPDGDWALKPWSDSIRRATTIPEKWVWVNAFQLANLNRTSKGEQTLTDLYSNLLVSSARTLDMATMKKASDFLEKYPERTERNMQNYAAFLSQALQKDTLYAELLGLAGKVTFFAKSRVTDLDYEPGELSRQMHLQSRKRHYVNNASIYGVFLYKNGQQDSAIYFTHMAASYHQWQVAQFNDRYFRAADGRVSKDTLMKYLELSFRREGYTRYMKDQFLKLAKAAGLQDGEQRLMAALNEKLDKAKNEARGKMMARNSPAFSLPGLYGGTKSFESLRGKVVLLDFWATWCRPCIASFPSMQQLVDLYKDHSDVAFLFIDTYQTESDKYELVKKFMTDTKYRFDVYMDEKSELAKSIGVKGIPTKVIIDKNGIIRFISVGFNGDEEKGLTELQAMIEVSKTL